MLVNKNPPEGLLGPDDEAGIESQEMERAAERTAERTADVIAQFDRQEQDRDETDCPDAMMRDVLELLSAAHGGHQVPLCCVYPGGPFGRFDSPIPYIWVRFEQFVESLGRMGLNADLAILGMDSSD